MQLRHTRLRRWLIAFTAGIGVILLAVGVLTPAIAPILGNKLRTLAQTHLDATLQIADLSYRFPWTIRLRDIRLRPRQQRPDGILDLRVASAVLTLDKLPIGGGPLLVRSIDLDQPTMRIIRSSPELAATMPTDSRPTAPPSGRNPPLRSSDVFRLRQLTVRGGQIIYEDQALPDAPPMIWCELSSDLRIDPGSASLYAFQLTTRASPVAELTASGTFDLDTFVVSADHCSLSANVDGSALSSPLPAEYWRVIQTCHLRAKLHLQGSGRLPLRDLNAGSVSLSARLSEGSARLPRFEHELRDVSAVAMIAWSAEQRKVEVSIASLTASAGGAHASASLATGTIDFAGMSWRADVPAMLVRMTGPFPTTAPIAASGGSVELQASFGAPLAAQWSWRGCQAAATFHDVAVRLDWLDFPLESIHGTLRLGDGALHAQSLQCNVGNDTWRVRGARLPLEHLPERFALLDVDAEARFVAPGPRYPFKVGQVIAYLRPQNTFTLRGAALIDSWTADNHWEFRIGTDDGAFTLASPEIEIAAVRGQASISPRLIDIRNLRATAFDGMISGSGTIDPRGDVKYGGSIMLKGGDVSKIANALGLVDPTTLKLVGRSDISGTFAASRAGLAALRGEGEMSIHDAELWEAPVLRHVVEQSRTDREALTASDAAAVFRILDAQVHLDRAAMYSPALGLQGSGTIGLDGRLNLQVVAAPLGNWEKHIRSAKIPLMSNVIGTVAGAMQQAVNAATGELLYEFRVTGRIAQPQVEPLPTPVLTDSAAFLFERMLRGQKDLVNAIRPPPSAQQ